MCFKDAVLNFNVIVFITSTPIYPPIDTYCAGRVSFDAGEVPHNTGQFNQIHYCSPCPSIILLRHHPVSEFHVFVFYKHARKNRNSLTFTKCSLSLIIPFCRLLNIYLTCCVILTYY